MTTKTIPNKKFQRYVESFGNFVEVAAYLKFSKPAVSLWYRGKRRPRLLTKIKIAQLTSGQVSVKSWDAK